MNDDQRWRDWLFERHSQQELEDWAPTLKYFRYCRAYGGHANDGDALMVAIRFASESELRSQCAAIGIVLAEMPPDAPRPVKGVAYRGDEYARFISFVDELPHLRQPGHIALNGVPCFAWVHKGRWELAVKDPEDAYEVTRRCIDGARALEPALRVLAASIEEPPRDNKYCVCPKYYPRLWRSRVNTSPGRTR